MKTSNYLVSNELGYQNVISHLERYVNHNSIYVGVGPEQNFTYISAIRPSFAFIIDNRKENQLLHYLFRSCFELALSRQDYLSLLFSKPLPVNVNLISINDLITHFLHVKSNKALFEKNWDRLYKKIQSYRKNISIDDLEQIKIMYNHFFQNHLLLRTRNEMTSWEGWPYPSYQDFLLATDHTTGYNFNFLNDDRRFQLIKTMQQNNRIIPITGDLTGNKTLKEIGKFAEGRGKGIGVLYISNAEHVIFQENLFDRFLSNIIKMPKEKHSIMIRSIVNKRGLLHPGFVEGQIMTTVIQNISTFTQLYQDGRYKTYWDVATLDFIDL